MSHSDTFEGVLVVGTPRSGTTLVRRLLDAHPEFASPGETNLFVACARFLSSDRLSDGLPIGVLSGLAFAGYSEEEVLDRLRAFAFGFLREYAEGEGKKRWVEKTAFNAFHLEPIERLCSDRVRYVCIVRHGLDVASSITELSQENGTYLRELHDYVSRYAMPLEAFAHVWADLTEAILALVARQGVNALLIRYEDLVRSPNDTIARVMAFLGCDWDPSLLGGALEAKEHLGLGDWKTYGSGEVHQSSVGRWRSLPPYAVGQVAGVVNPLLEELGYETVSGEVADDEAARRRYELAMMIQGLRGGGDDAP